MMKSRRLKKGNCIGVCAPSGFIKEKNKEELKKTENYLKELNINVIYSKNLYARKYGYSASVEEKVEDLNTLINDKNINAVAFAKGGNNANAILDYIDYECIKNNPKIFFGFSDNTILLNAIYKKTGLITYHFNNFKGLFDGDHNFNKEQFINAFIEGNKGLVKKNSNWITINPGVSSGKLIGGNLGTLVKLLNTKYCPSFKNNILFIEDLAYEDSVEQVSSLVYQLKQNGVFKEINGLLIGNYDSQEEYSMEQIVKDAIGNVNFPIIKCNDFGHTSTNIVLPIGAKCTLDGNNCELIIDECMTKKGE